MRDVVALIAIVWFGIGLLSVLFVYDRDTDPTFMGDIRYTLNVVTVVVLGPVYMHPKAREKIQLPGSYKND